MSFFWPRFQFGTNADDTLFGSAFADIIFARRGNDEISSGLGNDRIFAGFGDDTVDAGAGDDIVFAGFGNDLIRGGAGDDKIFGGFGFDTVTYEGSISDYDISRTGYATTVTSLTAGLADAGADKLYQVEALYFAVDDYTLFLDGTNNAVLAGDDAATTGENDVLILAEADLLANDQEFDGDAISITSVDAFSDKGAAITFAAGSISYDPGSLFDGLAEGATETDTFTYTVDDGKGGFDTATVTVTIVGTNDAPELSAASVSVAENTTAVAAGVSATDVDSASLSFSLEGADAGLFSIDSVTGAIAFLAAPDFEAPGDADTDNIYDLTVKVTDSAGATDTADIAVTVTDVAEIEARINEFHYDNAGGDVGEFVEVRVSAGDDASGLSVVLYNGSNGASYNTLSLGAAQSTEGDYDYYLIELPANGLQNGSPDGIALVNGTEVIEFLSYEGTVTATNGPAAGLTSTDIGVSETSATPAGASLERDEDLGTWSVAAEDTRGRNNDFVPITDPLINEFVANHTGSDTEAFIEILGDAETDYSDFWLLEIEGDSGSTGTIDAAIQIGTTDASGYFLSDEDAENGSLSFLLVEGFTGAAGDDIDTDDDGAIDAASWSRIVDSIAVSDGGASDLTYGGVTLTPGLDGVSFGYGGASRIPNGTDTDTVADWVRNDFSGEGLPGFGTGTADPGEAINTPGADNSAVAPPAADPLINEFVANHTGSDTEAFIEILGDANTDYSSFWLLEIEGDAGSAGTIDAAIQIGTTDASGYFLDDEDAENGTVSFLLVENFTGAVGDDIDADDDGVIDAASWDRIADAVAVSDGGGSDLTYGGVTLAPGDDGVSFTYGGASRIPNGTDTDTAADWVRNDFSGEGLPGFGTGTTEEGEAFNTPGADNVAVAPAFAGRLNEIHYDNDGGDVGEFIEVRVTKGADVSQASVELYNGNGGAVYASAALSAGVKTSDETYDYYVLDVATLGTSGIQNGAPDGFALINDGAVLEFFSYEGTLTGAVGTTAEGLTSEDIGVAETGTTAIGQSLQRNLDGTWRGPEAETRGAANDAPVSDITLISAVQGSGDESPFVGQQLTVSAIVTQIIDGRGFFVQEEDTDADADSATSEGLFVFTGGGTAVTLGDLVEVTGTVTEFSGETQLGSVSATTVISSGNALPTATAISLAPGLSVDFESLEGMLVTITSGTSDPLTVIENFNLERFGEITISAGTQTQPTQLFDAQTEAAQVAALAEANATNRILLDNGTVSTFGENPDEFEYLPGGAGDDGDGFLDAGDDFGDAGSTLRLGAEITAPVQGVVSAFFTDFRPEDEYRVIVGETLQIDETTNVGARDAAPEDVGGTLQVASFNVLNYFTTFSGSTLGGVGVRGADDQTEFDRQSDKIVQALEATGADVIGLQEIENGGFADGAAIDVLVDELNAEVNPGGTGPFAFVNPTGVTAPGDTGGLIGTDAITTGIIYDTTKVALVHSEVLVFEEASAATTFALAEVLNPFVSSGDQLDDQQRNRPSVAATFEELDALGNPTGNTFTVVSSHFKSKGPSGLQDLVDAAQEALDGGATGFGQADIDALKADPNFDQGDGQAYWNAVRTDAAVELADWIENDYNGTGAGANYVLLGDLNAYAEEDPVQALDDDAGLVDLIDTFVTGGQDEAYSFVFDGQQGSLDHGIASTGFADLVTGATEWHINADEPDLIGYDTSFTNPAFYNDGVYASSDHDPLIVGIAFDLLS